MQLENQRVIRLDLSHHAVQQLDGFEVLVVSIAFSSARRPSSILSPSPVRQAATMGLTHAPLIVLPLVARA
jgi:hypothetical protein